MAGFFEGVSEGLNEGQQRALQQAYLSQLQQQNQGMQGAGNAASLLYTGQVPYTRAQPQTGLGGIVDRIKGLFGNQAPPPQMVGGPSPSPQPPLGGGPAMPAGAPPGAPSPVGAPPPGGGAPGGQPPGQPMLQPGQQLELGNIIKAIKQANPNYDGAQIMAAVQPFEKLLSQQSLAQYRQLQLALGQARNDESIRSHDLTAATAAAGRGEKTREFDINVGLKKDAMDERRKQFGERMDFYKEKLGQAKDLAEKARIYRQIDQANKDMLRANQEQITAKGNIMIPKEEQDRLQKQAQDMYDDAQKRIDALKVETRDPPKIVGGPLPKGEAPKATMKPGTPPPPEAVKSMKPGNRYLIGGVWWKLGPDGQPIEDKREPK